MISIYELQSEPSDVYYDTVAEMSDDTPIRNVYDMVKRMAIEEAQAYEDRGVKVLVEMDADHELPCADIWCDDRVVHKFYAEKY